MRRLALAFVASMLSVLSVLSLPAFAAGPVDNAVAALKGAKVYVEPGTPGTTRDSSVKLGTWITPDDHIALIVLPGTAKADSTTVDQLAQIIDDRTGHKYILGLAVGNEYIGLSSLLPTGVASDSMSRAASLANNPVDVLTTYAKIIHSWQSEHPDAKPESTPQGNDTSSRSWLFLPVALVVVGLALFMLFRIGFWSKTDENGMSSVRFKKTPGSVKDEMNSVLGLRSQLKNPKLVESLTNIGRHTEAYFRNAKEQPDGTYKNVSDIREGITTLKSVVSRYIKVQDEPFYYRGADGLIAEYSGSVYSFERFMLEQVRSANADEEFDFRKMAEILSATDLRSLRREGN